MSSRVGLAPAVQDEFSCLGLDNAINYVAGDLERELYSLYDTVNTLSLFASAQPTAVRFDVVHTTNSDDRFVMRKVFDRMAGVEIGKKRVSDVMIGIPIGPKRLGDLEMC